MKKLRTVIHEDRHGNPRKINKEAEAINTVIDEITDLVKEVEGLAKRIDELENAKEVSGT